MLDPMSGCNGVTTKFTTGISNLIGVWSKAFFNNMHDPTSGCTGVTTRLTTGT
jgi:hypothetical protein